MPTVKNQPPETIYLQCYDEYDGSLLDVIRDDVTWCRDRINDNDAVYILVTPELAELLERLAGNAEHLAYEYHDLLVGEIAEQDEQTARELATCIKDSLA